MKPSKLARRTTVVGLVVALLYVITTIGFVAPQGPVKTALQPLTNVASPYFSQKWNVFAPNIATSNPQLRFQAQWLEDGERVKSEWVNITDIEFTAIPGNLLPSRAHKTSWNLQSRYLSYYNKLETDQKKLVRDTFIERHGDDFRAKSLDTIRAEMNKKAGSTANVNALVREDSIVKEYVTYWATAYFEREIIRVRWQVYREFPNKFEDRHNAAVVREPTQTTFGWRHVDTEISPDTLAIFADLIDRYDRSPRG